mmetsp:Transcript_88087/g.257494  ORF Transcript_88087/g.257494 Transcript_88087/m.257494 type:complete len:226 (-) Transcript_88087:621-1298(-)
MLGGNGHGLPAVQHDVAPSHLAQDIAGDEARHRAAQGNKVQDAEELGGGQARPGEGDEVGRHLGADAVYLGERLRLARQRGCQLRRALHHEAEAKAEERHGAEAAGQGCGCSKAHMAEGGEDDGGHHLLPAAASKMTQAQDDRRPADEVQNAVRHNLWVRNVQRKGVREASPRYAKQNLIGNTEVKHGPTISLQNPDFILRIAVPHGECTDKCEELNREQHALER